MIKRKKIQLFLLLFLLSFNIHSQTYTFSNTTTATINSTATTTRNITVSGVPTSGMVLQQVNIEFSRNALYGGDMAKFNLTLTDPNGTVQTILSPSSFTSTSSSGNKWINIKFRDHAALKTPKQQATATGSTLSKGYPFNQGYYKPEQTFSSFNTTTNVNGTWAFKMSAYSTSYGRIFRKVELIFGPPLVVTDIRGSDPNQSCSTPQCIQTGDLYWARNIGYPTNQAGSPPNTVGGCNWNGQKDNMAWFSFVASATTATVSASGFSTVQESSVFKTPDCSSYTSVSGGCGPSDLFQGSVNGTKYYNGSYAGGYAWNQEYNLTGLTIGDEYLFTLDGQSGTQSEFYIELLAGGDGGCVVLPVELIEFNVECANSIPRLTWTTLSEINNDYFTIERSVNAVDYEVVGMVNGSGNSSIIVNYNWSDDSPLNGTVYYRLKQTDFNGTFKYKEIKTITCGQGGGVSIFPNPFENNFTIQLSENTSYPITVDVIDYLGRKVYSQTIKNNTTSIILGDHILSGPYFIKVFNEKMQVIEKIIKLE